MSSNPFDDENGTFHVLVNDEEHSLWPSFQEVQAGPATRQQAIDDVDANWTELRPESRRDSMAQPA